MKTGVSLIMPITEEITQKIPLKNYKKEKITEYRPISSNLWAKVAVTSMGERGQGVPNSSSTMLSKSLLKMSIR